MKEKESETVPKLLSRCGIYCGACYIYRAFKDRGRLLEIIAENVKAPKEEIHCNGCLGPTEDLWRNCRNCQIRSCLQQKKLAFCFDCPEFERSSCSKYESLCEFCMERDEDIREALMRIRAGDGDRWLEEQNSKWRCAECGGSVYWTEETCHHCGKPIRQIKTS